MLSFYSSRDHPFSTYARGEGRGKGFENRTKEYEGEGRGSTGSVRTYLKFVFNVLRNKQDSEIDEEIALLKCDFILIQIMRVSIRNFISYT